MGFPVQLLNQRRSGIPGIIKANARALYHTKAGGISGSLLLDQSPLNSGTRRTGEEGRCYLYDRTDDYSNLNSTVSIAGDFSFCFNVNFTSLASSQYLFSKSGLTNDRCYTNNGNDFYVIINNDVKNILLDSSFQVGIDAHICIVRNSGVITIYKDGVTQSAPFNSANTFEFNRLSDASVTLGAKLFDVRIYNKALTQSEVDFVRSFGQTGTDPNLPLHWWKCDEQSGTVGYDSVGGNHLTHNSITEATFHATQDIWSFQNQVGYNTAYTTNGATDSRQILTYDEGQTVSELSFKIKTTDTQAVVFTENGTSGWILVMEPSSSSTLISSNSGSPEYYVDGVQKTTRGELSAAIADGTWHDVLITNISLNPAVWVNGLFLSGYGGVPFAFNGTVTNFKYNTNITPLSGSPIIIPRDESNPLNDVLGNPLTNTGRRPNDAALHSSNCLTADGTLYIVAAHLVGTETVVSSGGTSTPSISAGRINFTAGTCWDLTLSDGTHYPLSEGGGIGIHDDSGAENHGILTNAVLANAWGGSQDSYHSNLSDGFVYAYQPAKQVFTGAQAANITGISFKFRSTDTNLIIFSNNTTSLYLIYCYIGSAATAWTNAMSGMTLAIDGSTEWGTTLGDLYNALCDGGIHEVVLTNLSFASSWVTDGIFVNRYTGTQQWDSTTYIWDLQATDSNGDPIIPADPDVRLPAVTPSLGPYSIPLTDLPSDSYHNRAETLIDLDPDSTPEMGSSQLGITVPASHAFGDAFAASDQIFSRQRTLTEDRFVVMPEAQTGSALATIQKYTQP